MIELVIVIVFIALVAGVTALWEMFSPDPDLTEADRDTMCPRCGVRGWPKHVHVSDR